MRQTLYDYCIEFGHSELLEQWEPDMNELLTPRDVTYGSMQKVWWRCREGHIWQTSVCTRTSGGSGCPYCAGLRVSPGENDLASNRPDIAAQWHPTKNGPYAPADVSVGSHKAVWWICEKGHEWRAEVKSRVEGRGCPVCANRVLLPGVNDLASVRPDLARQWDSKKNSSLTPDRILPGSGRKVWWKCEKGHQWQASVISRTSHGSGCPVCAGKLVVPGENDLASKFPLIAAQWDSEKNGALSPKNVTFSSNRKVWWQCELGHEYPATVTSRTTRNNGCPYCAGRKVLPGFNDLATVEPETAKQWHPFLNGSLTPEMVTSGSRHKIWWQCPDGHAWKAVIYSRTGPKKCGCPVCAGRVIPRRQKHYQELLAETGKPTAEEAVFDKEKQKRTF